MTIKALFAAAGALALGLSMFNAPALADVEITFHHYQVDNHQKVLRSILDEFEAANPGVSVKDVYSAPAQITADVQTALAARRPVDIATVIGKNIRHFIRNTPAVALNEDPSRAAFLDAYLPNFLDVGRDGDKVYAAPYAYGTPMMYYNKDLFRKAGLDPEKPPVTWDETLAAARTIKDKAGANALAHMLASSKDYGTMLLVMNSGGQYLSADGTCALFGSAEGIAGIRLWQDMVVTDKVMTVAVDRQYEAAFQAGQLGIFLYSSAALRPFAASAEGKFEMGVAGYPEFKPGQTRRLPNSGAALMLYAPEGERRDAALDLLAFMARREISNRWARESGYMPIARDPLADPEMAKYVAEFPFVRPVIDQMAVTVPTATWGGKGALEAQAVVSSLVDEIWAGKGDTADLVPDAVKRMNAALGCTTN